MSSESIAFIGTGVMGRSMASHLMDAGYSVAVYNRTRSKAEELLEKGALWRDSPAAAAEDASVVITIVGYPEDVAETYLGDKGVFSTLPKGGLAIDMTTSKPKLAELLWERGRELGISVMDAPVSGGDLGAREARLSIMVGGDEEAFFRAKPLFEIMGGIVVHQGEAGAGQKTKMCNQIAIAGGMIGLAESLSYAKKAGLRPETVLQSIQSGAAGSWSMTNLVPRAFRDDYAPGFFVKHFLKDLKIALESADELKLDLPGTELAARLYEKLVSLGFEDLGTQALFRNYEELL
ncbi:NAD(P)-dependent oxidoreductase [Puniceicoccaceae bacterium K14]|nr:NAD(P)-dependent oxidoreductase [Puniceicoccaceae bacterium K14]